MKKPVLSMVAAVVLFAGCHKVETPLQPVPAETMNQNFSLLAGIPVAIAPVQDILPDGIGYNTRFPDTAEPWGSPVSGSTAITWADAYETSFANCVRYPGGTVANFWNANQNKLLSKKASGDTDGWIDLNKVGFDFITDIVDAGNQKVNSLSDLKKVTDKGASVLFVMNLITPGRDFYASPQGWNRTVNDHPGTSNLNDDWYKMLDRRYEKSKKMLIKAQSSGVPIRYIELGNEVYLANSTYYKEAFRNGEDYAIAANYIAGKLRNDPDLNLPSHVKFSVAGAAEKKSYSSSRILPWNSQMVPNLDINKFDYISLHGYQEADTVLTTYTPANLKASISEWLSEFNQSLADKGTNSYILNASTRWKVWWNELGATLGGPFIARKWGSTLTQVFVGLWSLDHKGVLYMFPNFDAPSVVDVATGGLGIQGHAFVPFMRASRFAVSARKLTFPGCPVIGPSGRTVLQGYCFIDANGTKKCCIISLTDQPIEIDLSNVFSASQITLSGKKNSDLNSTAAPASIPDHTETTNSVSIEPYSVNMIRL